MQHQIVSAVIIQIPPKTAQNQKQRKTKNGAKPSPAKEFRAKFTAAMPPRSPPTKF